MSAAPTSTKPARSSSDHICGWSADFDVDPFEFREAVVIWSLVILVFIATIIWLGISIGFLAIKLGLV